MINALLLIPEITKGMKSMGSKSLLKIKNSKHIIEYQIEQLLAISKTITVHIATGFDNDKIKKTIDKYQDIHLIHNIEYEYTNYGRSLRIFMNENLDINNLLIVGSGILFKKGTISHSHLKNNSRIFILDKPKNNFHIGCNSNENIEYLFYDLPEPWTECVYLNQEALGILRSIMQVKNIDQMYIFEIINDLLVYNTPFEKQYVPKHKFFKISSIKDINKARIFV